MIVFVQNKYVPAAEATVSIFDRGFLYGDGLFETLRIYEGHPFRWQAHMERLERGAVSLGIPYSFGADDLRQIAHQLVKINNMPEALLRITISRGAGTRGYSPKGCDAPTLVMALFAPPGSANDTVVWRLITARSVHATAGLLAGLKSCNRLPQVLARAEADTAGADEALLLNAAGQVAEGAASNLFCLRRGEVCTPPLVTGALPGVTRAVVKEICWEAGLKFEETPLVTADLHDADAVFLSLSSLGIVEAEWLDERPLQRSPLVRHLQQRYATCVRSEAAKGQ